MLRLFNGLRGLAAAAAAQPCSIRAVLASAELSSTLPNSPLLPIFGALAGLATKAGAREKKGEVTRPISGYAHYIKDVFPKLRQELPKAVSPKLMQEAAKRYRTLSDSERQVYAKLHEAEKAKYSAAKADAEAKDKRILTAHNLFVRDNFSRVKTTLGSTAKTTEVLTALSKEWKALPAEGRAPYEARAAEAKSKILAARKACKRPGNAYSEYVKANFERVHARMPEGTPAPQVHIELGSAWHKLSQAEKDAYKPSPKP